MTRTDVAIASAADTLLSVCALQTGEDPEAAIARALRAIADVASQAEQENLVDYEAAKRAADRPAP